MFECKICNQKFKECAQLTHHLKSHNIDYQSYLKQFIHKPFQYYDIFLTPGTCPICGKSIILKYNNPKLFCSNKCSATFKKNSKLYIEKSNEARKKTNLELYGVENVMESDFYKQKLIETNQKRYGGNAPACSKEVQELMRQTNLEKYGVEYAAQADSIKQKTKETNLEKYGVEWQFQLDSFKNLSKETNLEKYGTEYASQSDLVKNLVKQSFLKKYGAENYTQSEHFKENKDLYLKMRRDTNLKRYGVENYTNNEKRKKTCLKKYGVETPLESAKIREKIKETNIEKYGTEHPSQLPEIQQKIIETKKKNHTFNTSKSEEILYSKLVKKFGESDIIRQYKSEKYPFLCDFYIKSLDLYIELQGFFTHGTEPFNPKNIEHIRKALKWKKSSSNQYKCALKVWTITDPLKRRMAKENNLNYIEVFDFENFSEIKHLIN